MRATIFVTGGSGFVGSAVIDELLAREYSVRALVDRRPVDTRGERVTPIAASLFDPPLLAEKMRGCAAVIHLVGIIIQSPSKGITFERLHVEASRSVIDAARTATVRRFLHMSALGTRPGAVSDYHRTKYQAEECIRGSNLDWTIFRPSLIHGPKGEFMQTEARWARKKAAPFLFMPYFGAGAFGTRGAGRLQPIHVADVARALVDALAKPRTIGQVYPIGGADRLSWPELHRQCAQAIVGHRRWVMPLPAWYARLLTRVVPRRLLPFNRDQVIMSQEDNTCDLTKFTGEFGWTPRSFPEALTSYAPQL
jgi:NADH dehydrogenase